jgi:transcriptional regulator with XRE-family HTH domain
MPKNLNTWGDHIKKRRLELGLFQRELAERLGVDESTIHNWERDYSGPALRFVPEIIQFLGYQPKTSNSRTLGESIVDYRRIHGWSQKELARRLAVDPSTLARWEKGLGRLSRHSKERLEEMLDSGAPNQQCTPDVEGWASARASIHHRPTK